MTASSAILAVGKTPVTSSAKSTPPDFIVTAPEETEKLVELKLAAPFTEVLALARFIVTPPLDPPPLKLVPAVTPVISPVLLVKP